MKKIKIIRFPPLGITIVNVDILMYAVVFQQPLALIYFLKPFIHKQEST